MCQQPVLETVPLSQAWCAKLNTAWIAWRMPTARVFRRFTPAALFALAVFAMTILPPQAYAETPKSIEMKLLVISADGTEPVFAAIKSVLNQVGVPYDAMIARNTPFNALSLSDGQGAGRYQGIILTTGNLGYETVGGSFESAFTLSQWQALWDYETSFRVRQVTLYTYPGGEPDNYGLNLYAGIDTTASPVQAQMTDAGKVVFNYLNPANPVTIRNAWTYLAMPNTSTNPVPLLKTSEGYAIVSINNYANGRSNLTITADGNPNLIHSLALGYGVINWVSKGMFLGSRKVYLNAQPDDILIDDEMWDATRNSSTGPDFRISGLDFSRLISWQKLLRLNHPSAAALTLEMPFNGVGASGIYPNDTLTPAVKLLQKEFKWVSHTYTHENLDAISYNNAWDELRKNDSMANKLGLTNYSKNTMIQPDISGLNNPEFLRAAVDFGIRYILSDTSQPGWDNPGPNAGFLSTYQPNILIIPRRPTNLYYNVSTPEEWVSEYNYFYAPGGLFPAWDRALTYSEIVDKESEIMLRYLLKYDIDSLMFHQPNLRAYDGTNSLLGDLINATIIKYERLLKLPIVSPGQMNTGDLMAARMAYNSSGVKATLLLGSPNKIALRTVNSVVVPFTGISQGNKQEVYGGQTVSSIKLGAGGTVTFNAPAW